MNCVYFIAWIFSLCYDYDFLNICIVHFHNKIDLFFFISILWFHKLESTLSANSPMSFQELKKKMGGRHGIVTVYTSFESSEWKLGAKFILQSFRKGGIVWWSRNSCVISLNEKISIFYYLVRSNYTTLCVASHMYILPVVLILYITLNTAGKFINHKISIINVAFQSFIHKIVKNLLHA